MRRRRRRLCLFRVFCWRLIYLFSRLGSEEVTKPVLAFFFFVTPMILFVRLFVCLFCWFVGSLVDYLLSLISLFSFCGGKR